MKRRSLNLPRTPPPGFDAERLARARWINEVARRTRKHLERGEIGEGVPELIATVAATIIAQIYQEAPPERLPDIREAVQALVDAVTPKADG